MKQFLFASVLLLISTPAWAINIVFATEPYPPYSFIAPDGQPSGAGVEVVRLIMREVRQEASYTIELMPWARALALAETQPNHCVFATARTTDRENRFQWVAPLIADVNFLVSRRDANIDAQTLQQATAFSVATQRGDFTEGLLKRQGFRRIDVSNTFETSLNKLLAARVDLMPMSESVFNKLVNDGAELKKVLPFADEQLGIACNRLIPSPLIARMQAALDTLRGAGIRDAIFQKYGLLPGR